MLAGRKAIARGIYQGVAQLADRTYWKNRALGMVEAVKFIGSLLAEDAWVENWETEYRTAAVTDNQKTCDQLLERFEKHEFQPLSSAEQGIRQACIHLQTLSWDQLVEHGAQLATSLALDCVILKAGEFALSPAGRAFMHDVAETLKLPKTKAQKHMVELAGIGKIALEESSEVATAVVKSIQKNPDGLAQEGKTTVQVMREVAKNTTRATGTVWDNIKMTDVMYNRTKIPRSFEITIGDKKFWDHPNATEHMMEYITSSKRVTHGMPINSGAPRAEGLLPVIYHAQFVP